MGVGLIEPGAGGGASGGEVKVDFAWDGTIPVVFGDGTLTLSNQPTGDLTGGSSTLAPDVTSDDGWTGGWRFPATPGVLSFSYSVTFDDIGSSGEGIQMLVDVADSTYTEPDGYMWFNRVLAAAPGGGSVPHHMNGLVVITSAWQDFVGICPYIEQRAALATVNVTAVRFRAAWTPL
jgi:hypothetical protein